jgi:hypothetical protein
MLIPKLRILKFMPGIITIGYILLNSTVSFAQAGQTWAARFEGSSPARPDCGNDVITDELNNVYVTGYSFYNSQRGIDCPLIKYNPDGIQQWVKYYDSPPHYSDIGRFMVIDKQANIYIAGISDSDRVIMGLFLLKYSTDSVFQWAIYYPLPPAFETRLAEMTIDRDNNVLICAMIPGLTVPGDFDIATIKYSSDGQFRWIARYLGVDGRYSFAAAITIDLAGNSYVTGYFEDTSTAFTNVTIKYDSTGQEQWVREYKNPDAWCNQSSCIGLDPDGNVYVSGLVYFPYMGELTEYQTFKYSNGGDLLWTDVFNPMYFPQHEIACKPRAMAVDSVGNVFITGDGIYNWQDAYQTLMYNTDGQLEWNAFYMGRGEENSPTDLAIDSQDNIYVTGLSYDTAGFRGDYVTIKYNPTGEEKWIQRYDGGRWFYDEADALTLDNENNIIVTGYSQDTITTIKYNQNSSNIGAFEQLKPQAIMLDPIYPNPFNSATLIAFSLTQDMAVAINIYNINGRLIQNLGKRIYPIGRNSVVWNATAISSGVYFIRINTDDASYVKKTILIK